MPPFLPVLQLQPPWPGPIDPLRSSIFRLLARTFRRILLFLRSRIQRLIGAVEPPTRTLPSSDNHRNRADCAYPIYHHRYSEPRRRALLIACSYWDAPEEVDENEKVWNPFLPNSIGDAEKLKELLLSGYFSLPISADVTDEYE